MRIKTHFKTPSIFLVSLVQFWHVTPFVTSTESQGSKSVNISSVCDWIWFMINYNLANLLGGWKARSEFCCVLGRNYLSRFISRKCCPWSNFDMWYHLQVTVYWIPDYGALQRLVDTGYGQVCYKLPLIIWAALCLLNCELSILTQGSFPPFWTFH